MKVTYVGRSDERRIRSSDFPDHEEDFEDLVWVPGSSVEVPDAVASWLVEFMPRDFAPYDDPKGKDHRTRDELLEEANALEIKGRSSMKKEDLLDAIYARRAEIEAEEENPTVIEGAPTSIDDPQEVVQAPEGDEQEG